MYEYWGKDKDIQNFFKGFLWVETCDADTEEYGLTKCITFTVLGTNFSFIKKVK